MPLLSVSRRPANPNSYLVDGLTLGSRKWMSGQAAALAHAMIAERFASLIAVSRFERRLLQVKETSSPLDFYLSWMSRFFPN